MPELIQLIQDQDTTTIVAEKQRLRDITKLVDDCISVEELKAIEISEETSVS